MFSHALGYFRWGFLRTLLFVGLISLSSASAQAVTIPTVPVGNAGNASDPFYTSRSVGGVDYDSHGTTEVTNAQYVEFLNAKAASDPLGLYNVSMSSDARGGITRSGSSGSYAYTLKPNMADKPVNYVTWYDSIRFANWLNNGQGNGATETGAYTILGGSFPTNGKSITRNVGATWFLPSESEWYKAAYNQPAQQGGDVDDSRLYPGRTNSSPTPATANNVGDITNPGSGVENFGNFADWNGQDGNVTTVGSAGPFSASYYGTFDQGGNVSEWHETLNPANGGVRSVRGGNWISSEGASASTGQNSDPNITALIGFRVATVPEPSTYALAAIGVIGLLAFRRRKAVA